MKYALLIYDTPGGLDALPGDERQTVHEEYMAIAQSPGIVGGEQLQHSDNATTVRVPDGQTLLTDGPYADTKEVLGGFFLFEADDLDTAVAIAERIPAARMGGAVEVRPVVEM